LAVGLALGASILLITGSSIGSVLVVYVVAYLIIAVGLAVLGGLAAPMPEPPPVGELRKVKLTYRCDVCGTELRITAAPTEDPEPPRHCMDEMRLVTPVD
jgi:hypothetical protein